MVQYNMLSSGAFEKINQPYLFVRREQTPPSYIVPQCLIRTHFLNRQ